MSVLLIIPSNPKDAPYVDLYIKVLEEKNIKYELLIWDRRGNEVDYINVYSDKIKGNRRGIIQYFKFKNFVLSHLSKNNYDKYIIFTIQMIFFLKKFIKNNYDKVLLDIRDYHKIKHFFNFNKLINNVDSLVISSRGFLTWIERTDSIISHNKGNNYFSNNNTILSNPVKKISYIGQVRDYDINLKLIKELRNNSNYILEYNGINRLKKLEKFVFDNKINNVKFTGIYEKSEERELYINTDIVNIMLGNDANSKTLLPNRLYNAIYNYRPILTNSKTYLSEIICKYQIGIVIDEISEINEKIYDYYKNFSFDEFRKNVDFLILQIEKEQEEFENKFYNFTKN